MNNALNQLIKDLSDETALLTDFGFKLNMNYELIFNDSEIKEGDISVVAVLRQEPTVDVFSFFEDAHDVYEGSLSSRSAHVLSDVVGIPIDDAEKLVYPSEIIRDDSVDVESITAKDMAVVLRNYAETGIVDFTGLHGKLKRAAQ
jgi:hypothetical protein